jgi:hypothetical protein
MTWEDYRALSTKTFEGREIRVIQGDIPVSLEELRSEYERLLENTEAHNQNLETPVATTQRPCTVNQVNDQDDVWTAAQAANLTYCISTDFGANHARMVAEMAQAAQDLEAVGYYDFRHVSRQDANCTGDNPHTMFAVRPWTGGGGCAFFPSGKACVARTVLIDIDSIDTDPGFGAATTLGVLRHELGHVLGLRHEHIRVANTFCTEGTNWRAVTGYDSDSVMHYPWCPGATNSGDLVITALDAQGLATLYPTTSTNLRVTVDTWGAEGRVTGRDGVDCYSFDEVQTCVYTVPNGPITLTFTASLANGWQWWGGACTGYSDTCTLQLSGGTVDVTAYAEND